VSISDECHRLAEWSSAGGGRACTIRVANLQMEGALTPVMISIPDDCTALAEAIERLVASPRRARHRARGCRAIDCGLIAREVGERAAEVERAAH